MRREDERAISIGVVLIGIVVIAALLTFGLNCAGPQPAYKPPPPCGGPTGRMMPAPNQINSELQSCFSCEFAQRCYDEGNHYCCQTPMCTECESSPVNFGAKKPDGGHR